MNIGQDEIKSGAMAQMSSESESDKLPEKAPKYVTYLQEKINLYPFFLYIA